MEETDFDPQSLIGTRVALMVFEPWDLIRSVRGNLTLTGRITDVQVEDQFVMAWLHVTSIDHDVPQPAWVSVQARYRGDSLSSLLTGDDVTVHGAFYRDADRSDEQTGYIGKLRLTERL